MVKAIIWDFDGVLIDSEQNHIKAEIETMKGFGVKLTREVAEEYLGTTMHDYFEKLRKRFSINATVDEIIERHMVNLRKYYPKSPLVPNVKEVLEILKRKYKLSVATSGKKDIVMPVLEANSLSEYFDVLVFADDLKKGKPSPEIFLESSERLGVKPGECVVIEDAANGIKAAKAAGMVVIARRAEHNKTQDFSLVDYVVYDLREIPRLLDNL